jgi:hypothetical protein
MIEDKVNSRPITGKEIMGEASLENEKDLKKNVSLFSPVFGIHQFIEMMIIHKPEE